MFQQDLQNKSLLKHVLTRLLKIKTKVSMGAGKVIFRARQLFANSRMRRPPYTFSPVQLARDFATVGTNKLFIKNKRVSCRVTFQRSSRVFFQDRFFILYISRRESGRGNLIRRASQKFVGSFTRTAQTTLHQNVRVFCC